MTDQQALVALNAVPGLGIAGVEALWEYFGSPSAIVEADFEALRQSGLIDYQVIENLIHFSKDKFCVGEYNQIQKIGGTIITRVDDVFPRSLKDTPGAPLVLYCLGNPEHLAKDGLAIVGSRIGGFYGKKVAHDFAAHFARSGLNVVSGLARGIDTAAHVGCLSAQGITVAVVGCGFDFVYPNENKALHKTISQLGVVVSEFPMAVAPLAQNFPRRNRIISGLSKAVVVIEAAEKSGALITVGFALEQGRSVCVVPGPIDSAASKGSNRLIRDGATIVLSAQDVLDEIGGTFITAASPDELMTPKVRISPQENAAYAIIETQPVHIDDLARELNLDISSVTSLLMSLELKNLVRQLPGQHYARIN